MPKEQRHQQKAKFRFLRTAVNFPRNTDSDTPLAAKMLITEFEILMVSQTLPMSCSPPRSRHHPCVQRQFGVRIVNREQLERLFKVCAVTKLANRPPGDMSATMSTTMSAWFCASVTSPPVLQAVKADEKDRNYITLEQFLVWYRRHRVGMRPKGKVSDCTKHIPSFVNHMVHSWLWLSWSRRCAADQVAVTQVW